VLLPLFAAGPVLAILFAAGIALHSAAAAGFPAAFGPPILRWAVAACFLLFLPLRRRPPVRSALAGVLALALGILRGASVGGGDSGAELPAGPARIEAWVAEVPVMIPARPGSGGPGEGRAGDFRTSFRTRDPQLRVSVDGAVPWIEPGQQVLLEGRLLPPRRVRNPGDRAGGPDAGASESPTRVSAGHS